MSTMIRPVRRGRELAHEIANTRPAPGALAVWWLGQSGFVVKSRAVTIVIDPYLSEHLTAKYAGTDRPHVRMTEAPLRGGDLEGVDLVFCTHKHSDHLDPGTIPDLLAASPRARLVLPRALVEHATTGLGLPRSRLLALDAGEGVYWPQFATTVQVVPSAHEGLDTDESGLHLYLGYVLEIDGLRLYHSGDSVLYDDLPTWLDPGPFDVFFLPINGRDPARGVAGNMSAREAVNLAGWLRPRYLVPHHYNMFTFNTVPVADFEAEAVRLPEGVTPRVLQCGERWEVRQDPNGA